MTDERSRFLPTQNRRVFKVRIGRSEKSVKCSTALLYHIQGADIIENLQDISISSFIKRLRIAHHVIVILIVEFIQVVSP